MFIPYQTDLAIRKTPWVNYALVCLNILIFVITRSDMERLLLVRFVPPDLLWLNNLLLSRGDRFLWYQLISYAFLHADGLHLFGNMLFLYVFGNNVEDRLGSIKYFLFYFIGCALGGVGHMLVSPAPLLGASGATSAVTGMFVALFPGTRIRILSFFGIFEWTSLLLIGLYFLKDLVLSIVGGSRVSYTAHMAGSIYGVGLGLGLIGTGIIKRSPYDLFSVLKQRYRRQQFQKLSRQGYQAWENQHSLPSDTGKGTKPYFARFKAQADHHERDEKLQEEMTQLKQAISRHLEQGQLNDAVATYQKLIDQGDDVGLSRKTQRELGTLLFQDGQYERAAEAFDRYLSLYGQLSPAGVLPEDAREIQLLLATLCARYLDQHEKARTLINELLPYLSGDDKTHAESLLASD